MAEGNWMRLNINLATRPYRDVRQFLRTWGTGTVLLALLTVGLCWYTFYAWHQTRNARGRSFAPCRARLTSWTANARPASPC